MRLETLCGLAGKTSDPSLAYPRVALPVAALKDTTRRQGGGLKAILDRGHRQRRR
jgi:hypothetical protein